MYHPDYLEETQVSESSDYITEANHEFIEDSRNEQLMFQMEQEQCEREEIAKGILPVINGGRHAFIFGEIQDNICRECIPF